MPMQAKQQAAPNLKGFVRIKTGRSFGSGDKVRMTSHGCFLKDRDLEISCCNCFTLRLKKIKPNGCVTTVEGLDEKLRHDLILADLKKMLRCDGGTYTTKEPSVVIWLHTENGEAVEEFLWKSGLAAKEKIKRTSGV
ncbi:SUI1 domain-containing protein [Psidium guajava]|nr:SUI1 domain-containing protein [Psidium guajava]